MGTGICPFLAGKWDFMHWGWDSSTKTQSENGNIWDYDLSKTGIYSDDGICAVELENIRPFLKKCKLL